MIVASVAILCVLLLLATIVQTCLLESMRLRARETDMQALFVERIAPRLGRKLSTDARALGFSLWKHGLLVALGLLLAFELSQTPWLAAAWAIGLMIVFAYLLPQVVYRRSAGDWLQVVAPLPIAMFFVVRPVVALFSVLRHIAELADDPQTPGENGGEEIEALLDAGAEEGLIEEDHKDLVRTAIEFGDKSVREVMTPRPNIVAIQEDKTLEDLKQLTTNHRFSRFPVYRSSLNDIVGFVHVRDMWEVPEPQRAKRKVREFVRDIGQVPEQKSARELLEEMQEKGQNMVVAVDEYGQNAGIVTMEDLIEELLGREIRDEHEPAQDYIEEPGGFYVVSGSYDLDRLAGLVEYKPAEAEEATTIGGLVTEWLGHVPQAGETVEKDGLRVEVLAASDLRVDKVRLARVAAAPEDADA
ncbi:MAG: hemolysin family protein [Bryobacteraceae bacterium]|nr:hemolysin family protein [Bryobacteraceae bacterium]